MNRRPWKSEKGPTSHVRKLYVRTVRLMGKLTTEGQEEIVGCRPGYAQYWSQYWVVCRPEGVL